MLPTLLCASESPTELVRKKDIQEKWVHITVISPEKTLIHGKLRLSTPL